MMPLLFCNGLIGSVLRQRWFHPDNIACLDSAERHTRVNVLGDQLDVYKGGSHGNKDDPDKQQGSPSLGYFWEEMGDRSPNDSGGHKSPPCKNVTPSPRFWIG